MFNVQHLESKCAFKAKNTEYRYQFTQENWLKFIDSCNISIVIVNFFTDNLIVVYFRPFEFSDMNLNAWLTSHCSISNLKIFYRICIIYLCYLFVQWKELMTQIWWISMYIFKMKLISGNLTPLKTNNSSFHTLFFCWIDWILFSRNQLTVFLRWKRTEIPNVLSHFHFTFFFLHKLMNICQ